MTLSVTLQGCGTKPKVYKLNTGANLFSCTGCAFKNEKQQLVKLNT